MILALLAASFTFTATATGVEKGTPLEFLFCSKGTDRDYETLFTVELSPDEFCRELEKAGIPRGKPVNPLACRFWPEGVTLALSPSMDEFVATSWPDGLSCDSFIYTGLTAGEKGGAASVQPFPIFALYTLAESPLTFDGVFNQGQVYGAHTARETLKKGEKKVFTISWDGQKAPDALTCRFTSANAAAEIARIRTAAGKGRVSVQAVFDDSLTIAEATAVARALSTIDSVTVKVNGRANGDFFYQAFLPLDKWRDRRERLAQPFELTVTEDSARLVFIEEDWSVSGLDPKLTERTIAFEEAARHPKTDTCFVYAKPETTLAAIKAKTARLPASVKNIYFYPNN